MIFYGVVGEEELPELKQFADTKITPILKDLRVEQRNAARNRIRYAETSEVLEKELYSLNKDYGTEIDPEELLQEFSSLQKPPKISQDNDVLRLLNEEEQENKYLDLGYTKDTWYFGFTLRGRDAILTSDGKIFRNTLEKFKDRTLGEDQIRQLFDYQGYIGNIAPKIAKETIKKFYTKLPINYLVKPKEVYKAIKEKILFYMDFGGKDEIADVLTCWVICTYCYPLFYWFPHILFNAPSQSGKSKCAFMITQLSFRGFDLGAAGGVTPPQIFRTLEGNRGTILMDEFEIRGNDPTQQLINQILNASTTKDAYVIRTEQVNKKWVAWKFPIFCPKIACNISGINPTSLSRFIAFKWLKTNSEKGKRKPYKEKDKKSFEPLREQLYLLILENWQQIKGTYENLSLNFLNNREEDNWSPLFAIAQFIDASGGEELNVQNQLKKYLDSYEEVSVEVDDSTQEFFMLLYENINEEPKYYTPKEIASIPEISELLNYLKSPAHWIGKKLKLYKFKQNRIIGARKYILSKEIIKKIIDTYYGTNIMLPNDPNDTTCHKCNQMTPDKVSLGIITDITPEGDNDTNKSEYTEEEVSDA